MVRWLPRAVLLAALAAGGGTACGGEERPADWFVLDGRALRVKNQARGTGRGPAATQRPAGPVLVGDPGRAPVAPAELAEREREQWPEELFCLELTSQQLELLERAQLGRAGIERLEAEVFAPGARIGTAEPEAAALVARGVERAEWNPLLEAEPLDLASWWERWTARDAAGLATRWVELVPVDVVRLTERQAQLVLRWQVNARDDSGALRHESGRWSSSWEPGPDSVRHSSRGWRCTELVPLSGETLTCARPPFVDVTLEALGGTSWDPRHAQPEVGFNRGLALVDVDGDADLDLVAALPNRLLVNDGEGRFTDRGEELGIAPAPDYYSALGADFDRDGDTDLVFAGKRKPLLYYERTDDGSYVGRPVLVSDLDSIPTSMAAHDVDGDGYLDLYVCGYGPFFSPGPNDPVDAVNARPNQMLRGVGDGTFEDVSEAWGLAAEASRWSFVGVFGDADEDGDADLYVANDFGPNVLYRREPGEGVRFTAEVERRAASDPGFSMSAMWVDLDGDQDLDMYVSNMASVEASRALVMPGAGANDLARETLRVMSKGNTVLFQEGEGEARSLREGADERGGRGAAWAWGIAVFDHDLDADLDVACVNGFWSSGIDDGRDWDSVWWRAALPGLQRNPETWAENMATFEANRQSGWSWAGHQRNVFFVNDGTGHFVELAPVLGLDQKGDARALAAGDLDGDGDIDLVGSQVRAPQVYVLENRAETAAHHAWVELVPAERRSAAGARIWLDAGGVRQRREVQLGSGYLSQHELAQHFGLGSAAVVERVEVRWPDGSTSTWTDLPVDRRLVLHQEGERAEARPHPRAAEPWSPGAEPEWTEYVPRLEPITSDRPDLSGVPWVSGAGPFAWGEGRRADDVVLVVDEGPGLAASLVSGLASRIEAGALEVARVAPVAGAEGDVLGFAEAEAWSELQASLSRWIGTHGAELPLVLVLSERGLLRGLARGEVEPGALEAFLETPGL